MVSLEDRVFILHSRINKIVSELESLRDEEGYIRSLLSKYNDVELK